MKLQLFVLCVAVFAASICEVSSLTNKQFYELVEPYLSESDVEDVTSDTKDADDDIVLPGGPDDEVNFDDVIKQLGVDSLISIAQEGSFDAEDEEGESAVDEMPVDEDSLESLEDSVEGGSCRCRRTGCSCCYSRRFKVWWKRFRVKVCAYVGYSRGRFYFRLTLNGRTVYRRYVRRSLTVCYNVPYTFGYAKACGRLYSINLRRKSFCLRLYARVWRYRVTFMRRCFRFAAETNAPTIAAKDFEGELEEYFGEQ